MTLAAVVRIFLNGETKELATICIKKKYCLLPHNVLSSTSIHAVTSLAVGSPQPAVVDDESGVVLLNGGVEPCDPIRRWSGDGLGCSVLAGGSILFRRGRVSLFRDLLIFFSGSHLTRPRDRGN